MWDNEILLLREMDYSGMVELELWSWNLNQILGYWSQELLHFYPLQLIIYLNCNIKISYFIDNFLNLFSGYIFSIYFKFFAIFTV